MLYFNSFQHFYLVGGGQEHTVTGPSSILSSSGSGGQDLLLQQQVHALRRALRMVLEEKWKLEASNSYSNFTKLKPLKVSSGHIMIVYFLDLFSVGSTWFT